MKMRMENGELASNDKQNVEVFEKHLTKVYNNPRDRYADAAKFIRLRESSSELDAHITLREFERAVSKLRNNKASGVTGVPAEAFKCLDGEHRKQVYFYIVNFWEGEADYWEWHAGLGVMVPQKEDLSDPNKWRGINLMDVC